MRLPRGYAARNDGFAELVIARSPQDDEAIPRMRNEKQLYVFNA